MGITPKAQRHPAPPGAGPSRTCSTAWIGDFQARHIIHVSHGAEASHWKVSGILSLALHGQRLARWVPNDATALRLGINGNDRTLCNQPRAEGLTTLEPFANAIPCRLSGGARDRPTDDVDAPTPKAMIIRMATKPRGAKVLDATSTIREWPRGVLGKERPDVEILHAVLLADKVLGAALTQTEQQQAIPI